MNELHLKYQQDTGIQISKQIESLETDYYYLEDSNYSDVCDYIKWLEEKILNND